MTYLYENKNVKVAKNGSQTYMLAVALYLSSDSVILEVKGADGSIKLSQPVALDSDLFTVAHCMATYRASAAGSPTLRFTFGTPLDAQKFRNSMEQALTQLSERNVPTQMEHLPSIREELLQVENSALKQENPVSLTQVENSTLIDFDQDHPVTVTESEPASSSALEVSILYYFHLSQTLCADSLIGPNTTPNHGEPCSRFPKQA